MFGARPDAVKMAPLVNLLRADPRFDQAVCVTAQHRQMLDQVLDVFGIAPDFDLNIMQESQTLEDITTRALAGVGSVVADAAPDIVLTHGDTTTGFAASLAAFYRKVPVGHVEAGLRTHNAYFPFPEEMNRKLIGAIASMHFAPTPANRENLLREGVAGADIYVTGNTAIDALKTTAREGYRFDADALNGLDFGRYRVLAVEAHRRENLGAPLRDILKALLHLLDAYRDMFVVFPAHLNPAVSGPVREALSGRERALVLEPLGLADMHNLMSRSYLVLSDSGGFQEEGPALGAPVLVLRNETERPEAVAAGTVRLAGNSFGSVVGAVAALADDPGARRAMVRAGNPYGDGNAAARIAQAIASRFLPGEPRPAPFEAAPGAGADSI
ncbi:MAG: UDP-N-acetylglucosamine 2-epimerase (non-hydrolyzing) [Clostridiales bacterium]|nr:UDP-N-acetylglucosamine 2-epimerase (non-hydrolyzing) [Clostridiales bacterium]